MLQATSCLVVPCRLPVIAECFAEGVLFQCCDLGIHGRANSWRTSLQASAKRPQRIHKCSQAFPTIRAVTILVYVVALGPSWLRRVSKVHSVKGMGPAGGEALLLRSV